MSRVSVLAALLILVSALAGGCNQSTSTASHDSNRDQSGPAAGAQAAAASQDIESVRSVPSEGKGLQSPAKQDSGQKFDPQMDPSSVTSAYLKSLQSALADGESLQTAQELLTAKAKSATELANVDVTLPGTENAQYVVHQAQYVTNEKNVAHVRTSWNDQIDDQKYEYDVTWVLKNEVSVGWRVAGMITSGQSADETVVFNFEDAADIVSKGGGEVATPETVETRTAKKKPDETIR